jgi:hypothetical protein
MANKVVENTARRIVAFSDDGTCKLIATRRANKIERFGRTAFVGSYWTLETFQRQGDKFQPMVFKGLPSRYELKQDVIAQLQSSVRFTEAYKELSV